MPGTFCRPPANGPFQPDSHHLQGTASRNLGLPTADPLENRDHTLFWQGLFQNVPRQQGVGFPMSNPFLATTETPTAGTSRLLTLRMKTSLGYVNIISDYPPPLTSTPEAKGQFYEALGNVLSGIPNSEAIYVLGNFNARVGAVWQVWPTRIGHQGIGSMNDNGQRQLEICCHYGLCITASYFTCKEIHIAFWRQPRSRHWHQLDIVIISTVDLIHTRTYHSADCDTDHSIVASKVRLKPRKIHHAKTKRLPRINTCSTSNPTKTQSLADNFRDRLATQPPPATLSPPGTISAMPSTTQRWPSSRRKNIRMLIGSWHTGKRCSQSWRPRKKHCRTTSRIPAPAHAKQGPPDSLPLCQEYLQTLCSQIQSAADCGYARGMCERIKTATGPTSVKTAPLKLKTGETINDQSKQLHRWVEHYSSFTRHRTSSRTLLPTPCRPASHGGARHPAHTGGAQQSHRLSHLWQGTGEGRYST